MDTTTTYSGVLARITTIMELVRFSQFTMLKQQHTPITRTMFQPMLRQRFTPEEQEERAEQQEQRLLAQAANVVGLVAVVLSLSSQTQ